jgi:hypothetical protein
MNALIKIQEAAPLSGAWCDTCGNFPCANPSFCKTCRAADLVHGYQPPRLENDLKCFACRARDLAAEWRRGHVSKADAADRAINFGLALGLHYRLARNVEDFLSDGPVDVMQAILAAAFTATVGAK